MSSSEVSSSEVSSSEVSSSEVSSSESIPKANVTSGKMATQRQWRTRLWWLTALCMVIAIGVSLRSYRTPGETIVIHFRDGHGIKPGDTLRYRGIDVGSVTDVQLDAQAEGIEVHVQLAHEHTALAVEGSQFWIARPRLRIGQVSGLETVLGAKFIGIIPGERSGARKRDFQGLDNPLSMNDQQATDVRIRFPAGEGLSIGDPVRYLGIDVGEVTDVQINDDLTSVIVAIRLVGQAERLARSGTQFWVERPRLDVSEVRGLETLVGGRYIAVEPTRSDSPASQDFVGLAEAPPLSRRPGSLELELEARSRLGLVRAAPITYRGIEVGRVADVGLASDSASVVVHVIIEPEYAELVRANSVWWSTGGVRLEAGITGVDISVDSFTSWLRGGIAFATPEAPGERVATGYRFGLAEQPKPEWLSWQPRIGSGPWVHRTEGQGPIPRVVRVAASWQTSFLGFSRRQSIQAWALPLNNGRMYFPSALARGVKSAEGDVRLEIAGTSSELKPANIQTNGGIASLDLPKGVEAERFPVENIAKSAWNGKTTLLVINPELREPLPLDASRASSRGDGTILINEAVAIHKTLEGSAVMEATSGELLGLLVRLDENWIVVGLLP